MSKLEQYKQFESAIYDRFIATITSDSNPNDVENITTFFFDTYMLTKLQKINVEQAKMLSAQSLNRDNELKIKELVTHAFNRASGDYDHETFIDFSSLDMKINDFSLDSFNAAATDSVKEIEFYEAAFSDLKDIKQILVEDVKEDEEDLCLAVAQQRITELESLKL